MTWTRNALAAVVLGGVVTLVGCEPKGPAEKAGEKIDNAARETKDTLDPRGPAEKVGDKIDKGVENLKDKLDPKGPAEKAGEAIDKATAPK